MVQCVRYYFANDDKINLLMRQKIKNPNNNIKLFFIVLNAKCLQKIKKYIKIKRKIDRKLIFIIFILTVILKNLKVLMKKN